MNASEPAGEWKLFRDGCPPAGYYWTRYAGDSWCEVAEVEQDERLLFVGTDVGDYAHETGREYWTVPLVPPE